MIQPDLRVRLPCCLIFSSLYHKNRYVQMGIIAAVILVCTAATVSFSSNTDRQSLSHNDLSELKELATNEDGELVLRSNKDAGN